MKYSSLKKVFQSDAASTIAKNQTVEKAEIFSMKCNCLQCMFSDNEIYKYFTRYHISYSLNGRTSAVFHCIEKPKRHFDKTLNADSNGVFFFFCIA